MESINITLNGKPYGIDSPVSLTVLLEMLGFAGKPVVIELNQAAIYPRDFPNICLADDDNVEIVTLAAGG